MDFSDVILQPGGAVSIQYKHFEIQAPRKELLYALTNMRALKGEEKRSFMRSVNKALAEATEKADQGRITQQEAMTMGQDCVFWYANEIIEGRATLEVS